MKNYKNEILSTNIKKEVLLDQLNDLLKNGREVLILPGQLHFNLYGFEGCSTFTRDEWLNKKKDEWLDALEYDEELEEVSFDEWLKDDEDDLFLSVEAVWDMVLEDL